MTPKEERANLNRWRKLLFEIEKELDTHLIEDEFQDKGAREIWKSLSSEIGVLREIIKGWIAERREND